MSANTNLDFHARLADAYVLGPDARMTPMVRASYQEFRQQIHSQYRTLRESGMLPVGIEFTAVDPYETVNDLVNDIESNGLMRVYTGSDLDLLHPMYGGINLLFRAVHDFYAHYGGFGAEHYNFSVGMLAGDFGEEYAYQRHKAMFTVDAWLALAIETRAQSAVNNLMMVDGQFIGQKCPLLDREFWSD